MQDIFCEAVVKKQKSMKDLLIKVAAVVVTVLALFIVLRFPLGSVIMVVLIVADYFLFKSMNIEYEYTLTMTNLDVAKIMSAERRKELKSFDLNLAEIIAPINDDKIKGYQGSQMKVLDYTSGVASDKVYAIIMRDDKGQIKVLFEPTYDMIKGMRLQMPSKVVVKQ